MTIDAHWMRKHDSDFSGEKLAALFDRPMSLTDVMTRREGAWADVSDKDRVWIFTREGATSPAQMLRWLARLATRSKTTPPLPTGGIPCSAFANGCANIAFSRASTGTGSDAYDREVAQQVNDAVFVLCGVPAHAVVGEDRYD